MTSSEKEEADDDDDGDEEGAPKQPKAKGKATGKGGKSFKGDKDRWAFEQERRAARGQWCRNFVQGSCAFGDRCWFRHS